LSFVFNFRFFNFLTFLANKNGAPTTSANPASSAPSNLVPVQQPPVSAQITPAPKRPVPIASAPSRPALIAPAPSRPALIPPSAPRLKQSLLVPMIRTDLASSSVVRTVIPTPPHLGENSRKPIISLNHLIYNKFRCKTQSYCQTVYFFSKCFVVKRLLQKNSLFGKKKISLKNIFTVAKSPPVIELDQPDETTQPTLAAEKGKILISFHFFFHFYFKRRTFRLSLNFIIFPLSIKLSYFVVKG
jgi:hypothetical protein